MAATGPAAGPGAGAGHGRTATGTGSDLELYIRQLVPWQHLPQAIRQSLGNSQTEWAHQVRCGGGRSAPDPVSLGVSSGTVTAAQVQEYCVRHQMSYDTSLARVVVRDPKHYYDSVVRYSLDHLMVCGACGAGAAGAALLMHERLPNAQMYPYHLADTLIRGLRVTAFGYYTQMLRMLIRSERSYDTLPNFTAADCTHEHVCARGRRMTGPRVRRGGTYRCTVAADAHPPRWPQACASPASAEISISTL